MVFCEILLVAACFTLLSKNRFDFFNDWREYDFPVVPFFSDITFSLNLIY